LDPRTKLVLTALFTVLVFVIDEWIIAAVQTTLFIGLCFMVKIPLRKIFSHITFFLGLIALVIVLQILFGQGLYAGLMISCRIITLTTLMPLLTMTTDTPILAQGLTRLGLPYRVSFIITSTLNLIPSFEEEARQIMDARRLRGIKSVKPLDYPAILLPLMIKAMRQANMIALAMDARAFGAYPTRTWLSELKLSAADYGTLAAGISWAVCAVTANHMLG